MISSEGAIQEVGDVEVFAPLRRDENKLLIYGSRPSVGLSTSWVWHLSFFQCKVVIKQSISNQLPPPPTLKYVQIYWWSKLHSISQIHNHIHIVEIAIYTAKLNIQQNVFHPSNGLVRGPFPYTNGIIPISNRSQLTFRDHQMFFSPHSTINMIKHTAQMRLVWVGTRAQNCITCEGVLTNEVAIKGNVEVVDITSNSR